MRPISMSGLICSNGMFMKLLEVIEKCLGSLSSAFVDNLCTSAKVMAS